MLDGVLPELPIPLPAPGDGIAAALRDGGLVLEDAEGTPVAALLDPRRVAGGLTGRLAARQPFAHGPLRGRRRSPAAVRREMTTSGPAIAVAVDRALDAQWPARVAEAARESGAAAVLVLVLVGDGRRHDLPPQALMRAVDAAVQDLPVPALVVPVALPRWPAGDVPADLPDDRLVLAAATAYGGTGLAADAAVRPDGARHPASAAELASALPPPQRRGLTVFFTGLSGSGKSTVAKALADRMAAAGRRTVSLLDGDEVRRLLSAGLGFSRADRDLNIRRIGFVAAEVTRHGGLAICAPIAPFSQAREEARAAVEEFGDFLLVHVSTPLAECERRDRKGLYARARAGQIPEFTGISSPYEVPDDAELRLDTSTMSVEEAVDQVWDLLEAGGYLSRAE